MVRKLYSAPVVNTEKVVLGLFGSYGSSAKFGRPSFPKARRNFFSWLFGWM